MVEKTRAIARKYGPKLALLTPAGLATLPAFAQEAEAPSVAILAAVNDGLSAGKEIAAAVVIGLFAIWAIKLLWRAK